MTKKELIEVIQKVVSVEVKKQIHSLLEEEASKKPLQNTLQESKKITQIRKTTTTTPKTFSKNPALNEILNETVPFLPEQRSADMINENMAPSVMPTVGLNGLPIKSDEVPPAVANIFSKDYSKLLKKTDEVAERNYRGGIKR